MQELTISINVINRAESRPIMQYYYFGGGNCVFSPPVSPPVSPPSPSPGTSCVVTTVPLLVELLLLLLDGLTKPNKMAINKGINIISKNLKTNLGRFPTTFRGDCYVLSEGLLNFLGSIKTHSRKQATASQTGYQSRDFVLSFKPARGIRRFCQAPLADSMAQT